MLVKLKCNWRALLFFSLILFLVCFMLVVIVVILSPGFREFIAYCSRQSMQVGHLLCSVHLIFDGSIKLIFLYFETLDVRNWC